MAASADANSNDLPDEWEWAHWTNLTAALPDGDDDGDGVPNVLEYRANTDQRDSQSALRLLPFAVGEPALRWLSVGGTRYRVEYNDDLEALPFQPVARPLADEVDPAAYGATSVLSFTDGYLGGTDDPTNEFRAYRIRVVNE